MGINIILPLIIGMALMVSLGSQVVPSFVEQMKVTKVENRTISNQNLIKDAIVRYIKMEKKVPKTLEELKTYGLLMDYHESNIFGGGYSFTIDNKKGTLKIFTKIDDKDAGKYFSNSFKFPNKPDCFESITIKVNGEDVKTCKDNLWETFYLLDEDTFKSIRPPEVGSKEDIEDRFTKVEEVGEKFDKDTLVGGEKDFIVDIPNNKVTEYVYDSDTKTWKEGSTIENIGGFGNDTKVFINSNLEIPYHEWNETKKELVPNTYTQEKVHCKDTTLSDKEVLVINENTGLAELVWVAPSTNSVTAIQTKIFNDKYTPNNICTSKVMTMEKMFLSKGSFDQPLSRWDTSNVTNMGSMFNNATFFNQPLNFDTSKVTNMRLMFSTVKIFNQPLNFDTRSVEDMSFMFFSTTIFNQKLNFDTSMVTSMEGMFRNTSAFNQLLNFNTSKVTNMKEMFWTASSFNNGCLENNFSCPLSFDTSNVTNMKWMFRNTSAFNQDIGKWDVSNVTNMESMFDLAKKFNQDLSGWCVNPTPLKSDFDIGSGFAGLTSKQPQWGTCPNP